MKREVYKINAENRVLGRLASEIAILLQGKNKPDFEPHSDMGGVVFVENADKIKVTGRKAEQKKYYRHSGYPGGIKETPFKKSFEKDPSHVLVKAVFGMLPKNKLRSKRIKRLKFK